MRLERYDSGNNRTGLFLALPEPLPLDERIGVSLRLRGPESQRHILARGIVVRQVPRDPDSHLIPGVGVRFTEIGPLDQRHIERYASAAVVEAERTDAPASGESGRS